MKLAMTIQPIGCLICLSASSSCTTYLYSTYQKISSVGDKQGLTEDEAVSNDLLSCLNFLTTTPLHYVHYSISLHTSTDLSLRSCASSPETALSNISSGVARLSRSSTPVTASWLCLRAASVRSSASSRYLRTTVSSVDTFTCVGSTS